MAFLLKPDLVSAQTSGSASETVLGKPLFVQGVQFWPVAIVNVKLGQKWRSGFEITPRSGDDTLNTQTLLIRTWGTYQVSSEVAVSIGYAYVAEDLVLSGVPQEVIENRIFQTVLWEKRMGDHLVNVRAVFEQRFIEIFDEVAHRLRLRAGYTRFLGERDQWIMQTSAEFFLNLNSMTVGPRQGWDQTRLLVGVGYQVGKNTRFFLNYIGVSRGLAGARPYRWTHVFQPSLIINL